MPMKPKQRGVLTMASRRLQGKPKGVAGLKDTLARSNVMQIQGKKAPAGQASVALSSAHKLHSAHTLHPGHVCQNSTRLDGKCG